MFSFDVDLSDLEEMFSPEQLRRALEAALKEAAKRIDANFDKRQAELKPLDKKYALRKIALGLPAKKLIASGYLRKNATDIQNILSPTEFELGTNVPYAQFVEQDRPFEGLTDEDFEAVFEAYIKAL